MKLETCLQWSHLSSFIQIICNMLFHDLLVELYWFKTAGIFQCRYQVVKLFCCSRIILTKAALLTTFVLKINKEQSVLRLMVTELSKVSSVVCLLLSHFVLNNFHLGEFWNFFGSLRISSGQWFDFCNLWRFVMPAQYQQ